MSAALRMLKIENSIDWMVTSGILSTIVSGTYSPSSSSAIVSASANVPMESRRRIEDSSSRWGSVKSSASARSLMILEILAIPRNANTNNAKMP